MSGVGQFGVHGGFNLTRENGEDGDLSGWLGIDKSINEELMIVGEYDFAINDNEDDSLGSGKGYLNLGAYWSAVPNVSIGFLMKNILRNRDDDSHSALGDLMTSQEQQRQREQQQQRQDPPGRGQDHSLLQGRVPRRSRSKPVGQTL